MTIYNLYAYDRVRGQVEEECVAQVKIKKDFDFTNMARFHFNLTKADVIESYREDDGIYINVNDTPLGVYRKAH